MIMGFEGVVAAFRVVVKEEPGVGEPGELSSLGPGELSSLGLVETGASLNTSNNGTNSSLLAMVNLEYVGGRNIPYLRIPLNSLE